MSITTAKNPLGHTTNITGDDLDWLVECMAFAADALGQWADEWEDDARHAAERNADDADECEWRATVKREERTRTVALAALLATATQVDVQHGVTA